MEMFQAFGFADKVKRETYWVNQTAFWMPDPQNPQHIKRVGRVQDVADDSSEMPHILINQARLHELFIEFMKNSPSRLEPDYGWEVVDLSIDHTTDDHPVTVTLKDASGINWWATRTIRANYVVGCDGAHSNEGNVLLLPREGGYIFRMYVELDKLRPDEKASQRKLTQDDMIAAANRIIKPYSIDVKEVVWWSIYDIGHSITDRFDDVAEGEDRNPRVFTAGDACHTHSPKAGQGMNVSMQDTFNLGWKLVHVLKGRANPRLLRSYSKERLTEAKRLVETDHKWSRIMSAPTTQAERDGTQEPRIIRQFKENLEFTGGTAVKYDASYLFAASAHQALAAGEEIGRRFHSAPVVRVSDAKQMHLGHVAEADARWRIYAFAGKSDTSNPGSKIHQLADWLETNTNSPVVQFTPKGEDIDAVIDFRAVFQQTFDQVAYENMPSLLKPKTGKLGLQDHEKVFCVDHKGLGDIFEMRGINREKGCMIVVRPDQYVSHVLPLDGFEELSAFFAGVLQVNSAGKRV
jgi:phenol 2-monooxygenase